MVTRNRQGRKIVHNLSKRKNTPPSSDLSGASTELTAPYWVSPAHAKLPRDRCRIIRHDCTGIIAQLREQSITVDCDSTLKATVPEYAHTPGQYAKRVKIMI